MNHLVIKGGAGTRPTLVLVLEPGNIYRMQQGDPVLKRLVDFFPDGVPKDLELLLFYSMTPIADAKEFAKMSKMTLDEREFMKRSIRPHCPECKTTIEQFGVFRNESAMAIVFCPECGCVYGMVPQEVVKTLPPKAEEEP
jgi:hypothetical protein